MQDTALYFAISESGMYKACKGRWGWSPALPLPVVLSWLHQTSYLPLDHSPPPSTCMVTREVCASQEGPGSALTSGGSWRPCVVHVWGSGDHPPSRGWLGSPLCLEDGCLQTSPSNRKSWSQPRRRNTRVVINHAEMMHCGLKMETEGTD